MMTNNHDSKRKSTSQGIASSTRPTKKKTTSSSHLVLGPDTSITYAVAEGTNTPLPSTRCDTMTPHVQEQSDKDEELESEELECEELESEELESEESDDDDSEYQDQENGRQPSCQRDVRCTTNTADEIRKIQADIAMMEARIVQARNRLTVLDEEIKAAVTELMAFSANNNIRLSLLDPFDNLPITFDFSSLSRRETQAYHLRCKVKDLSMMRNIAAMQESIDPQLLDSLRVQLRRALNRQGNVRTRDKRDFARRQSGICYSPDQRCIGLVAGSPSLDIGLVEMDNEQVSLKDIILIGDFARMLDKAWTLSSIDISEKHFFKELVKLVPSLSKTLLKNAWLALNMHNEGMEETSGSTAAGTMSHQQGIYMPFTMLLKAATVEDGLVNSSFKAGQDVYSSLSIACQHDERKLVIMPTAAATLNQGWDAFGMMEIKRSTLSNDGSGLMEYDRCVLMTAVTAVALMRLIQASDYDKVALPFIIWSGYNASLYVTRLDRRGNPVVSLVGYPSGDDSSVHHLSQWPCASGTKLFLAFAVLLHEFKTFFEASIKTRYNQWIQKSITLLEEMTEYTPTWQLPADCSGTQRGQRGRRRKQA